mmetsp:Transcript_45041/g.97834  ORF Transcript_45041/g.97834 Transcript_45041/m.97834 type:complete len:202 (+) Transcript_45041:366-971(+)
MLEGLQRLCFVVSETPETLVRHDEVALVEHLGSARHHSSISINLHDGHRQPVRFKKLLLFLHGLAFFCFSVGRHRKQLLLWVAEERSGNLVGQLFRVLSRDFHHLSEFKCLTDGLQVKLGSGSNEELLHWKLEFAFAKPIGHVVVFDGTKDLPPEKDLAELFIVLELAEPHGQPSDLLHIQGVPTGRHVLEPKLQLGQLHD